MGAVHNLYGKDFYAWTQEQAELKPILNITRA